MSRTGGSRPEYRLRFGYPFITIERVGAPPRRFPIDGEDPQGPLRGFAAEIARVGGRLKAVLPASEVWRGFVPAQGAAEAACRSGAEALGAPDAEIEFVLGSVIADGRRPAAAARSETIAEARAFLERFGLSAAEITATPSLPGFGARPALPARSPSGRRPGAPALAASGLAAMLALTLWLGPWGPDSVGRESSVVAEAPPPAVARPPAPPVLAEAPPAPARPATQPLAKSAALSPAATRPSPQTTAPIALAARNLPDDLRPPPPIEATVRAAAQAAVSNDPAPRPRPAAAPLTTTAAAAVEGPRPRPFAARSDAAPVDGTASPLDAAILDQRPLARPASPAPVSALVASLDPAILAEVLSVPAAGGPLARPGSLGGAPRPAKPAAPMRVSAPGPSVAALAAEAARSAPPALAAPPAPTFVRAQAAPRATPAQVRPARLQPQALPAQQETRRRPAAAVEQRVRAPSVPAPVVQPRLVQEPAAQTARLHQPRRETAWGRRPRMGRDDLALVGIFGGSKGRHALVQLPNGETERVHPGDELQGVQVTAIGADAVHLRARGRDTVLKLPN